jgi:UDP-glucuronate 4-epimerase
MKTILITGIAGFIGYHLAKYILSTNDFKIIGLDNINDYYSINLKYARLNDLGIDQSDIEYNKIIDSKLDNRLNFVKLNLEDKDNVLKLFDSQKFDYVVNLAAQAGVRYSIKDPYCYINSNILGFLNILEGCRFNPVKHLIYASSSSVYGLNKEIPFCESHNVDRPASLYAATKKSNELMAHTYSYLYNIPTTGLRFFTVYGPWGRPDMAYFSFTKKILNNDPIEIFNYGKMRRDFTYVDDIVEGIYRLLDIYPEKNNKDNDKSSKHYQIFNIGNNKPVELMEFTNTLEEILNKKVEKTLLPMQSGDVVETYANIDNLTSITGFTPKTNIKTGLTKFVEWYLSYYK